MKKILCLIVLMFMASACARQPSTVPPADSADRWQAFVARSGAVKEAPYLLNASLRFGTEGDTRRVTALLWGNDSRSLRMDVMAGIGAVVAKIWESGDEFLVYSPTENRAFFHQGSNKPLLRVGVPVPFALDELAALLNGRLVTVFGDRYSDTAMSVLPFLLPWAAFWRSTPRARLWPGRKTAVAAGAWPSRMTRPVCPVA